MSIGLAILLGVLQGLTEFFPVSSSGHLALFGNWFGLAEPDITFDILVHLATLAAIIAYFYKDWLQLLQMTLKKEKGDMPPMIIPYIIVSMIPAGLAGVFLKDQFEMVHHYNFWVGVCLLVTGVTLLAGLKVEGGKRTYAQMTWAVVIIMGLAQAMAILPGISRSGATIMAAVFMGMRRTDGARFSFLMAVPVIGGAGLLAVKDLIERADTMSSDLWMAYGAGFLAALVSGFVALAFMMKLLEARRFFYFGFYCLVMGTIAMIIQ